MRLVSPRARPIKISGITIVGALLAAGREEQTLSTALGFIAIVFASIGLMHAIEVVRAGGVAPYGVWGLALPISSLAAAALTGAAFYVRGPGRPRRAMFALAGLLFPLSAWPLIYSFGIFYVIAGWAVCFTLAAMNPPLRTSELRSRG